MTAEEKAAKKAAEAKATEAQAGNVAVVELVAPKQSTLIGSIEMINFKEANSEKGGKFNGIHKLAYRVGGGITDNQNRI